LHISLPYSSTELTLLLNITILENNIKGRQIWYKRNAVFRFVVGNLKKSMAWKGKNCKWWY
jgi:hypothetical protein